LAAPARVVGVKGKSGTLREDVRAIDGPVADPDPRVPDDPHATTTRHAATTLRRLVCRPSV